MVKKCKNEIVTINYEGFGNVYYSCISAIIFSPDDDIVTIVWGDDERTICENPSDVYGFIAFENGTEWRF